mmetsp:Transcript_9153/g.13283  ORF Transcript_9153/g.13283 Transcript_9153/m.13283 type:complete len:114 (-) Transcript_9153:140-481(-)
MEDLIKHIDIGVHNHEKDVTQPVRFDIEVLVPPLIDFEDTIDNVLDYEYLENTVKAVLSESRAELQETIAKRILDRILEPQKALAATVSMTKVEVMGFDGNLGCTLIRVKRGV